MKFSLLLSSIIVALSPTCLLQAAESPNASSSQVNVDGFAYVKTVGDISEYTLTANGLQVLLMPEHSAPVVTFLVTYHVGSRNEVTGTTGATHLLEHLMYKGTEKFQRAKGTGIDQLLERSGAAYNASTYVDRTNYYENIANDQLPLAVEVEADRMRNLLLREEDRRPEMTVVRNEFERGENSPYQALLKEMFAAAYIAHPYHHPTIGWRSDIEKVSIEKLREFYDTFYWPDNATVSVIGDFQSAAALELIRKFYGPIPRAPKPIPSVYTEEPEQTAARRVGIRRAGQLGVVAIGHKIPAATHPDFAAINVLSTILTDGKNSRLYRALTDKNLTTSIPTSVGFMHDPSLHIIFAGLAPGAKHEDVEKIMLEEIERVKKDSVTPIEVSNAASKILADGAFQRDGSFAIAGNLNECIAVGDWTTYYTLEERTKQVTADDVKRVANLYFVDEKSTIGWFVPTNTDLAPAGPKPTPKQARAEISRPVFYRDPELFSPPSALSEPSTANAPVDPSPNGAAAPGASSSFASRVERKTIAGVDVLLYKTGVKDVVTIRGSLPAGDSASPAENVAIATLTGSLLDKGTTTEDKFAIAQKLDAVGATLSFHTGTDVLSFTAKCLRKDAPLVISLLAEQLRTPAFSAEEFAKAKKQLAGIYKRGLENTDYRATQAFNAAVFPPGHPNHEPSAEEILAALDTATLDQVKAFHAAHYGPANLILVAVGDLDSAQVENEIAKDFAGWAGGGAVPRAPAPRPLDAPKEQMIFIPAKPSITVVIGEASGLKYSDSDYQALRAGTAILGSGFTGRLMATVRDKEGLTYGISSALADDTFNAGSWKISATFAPTLLEKGLASTQREFKAWYEKGVTAAELDRRKSNLIGAYKVNLATTDGLASQLLATIERGYAVSYMDEYPQLIAALTVDQVNAAIKKHLDPDRLVTIKAGTVLQPPDKK